MISARKGEFETGFERGGQTREHAMLAKTAGVKHLIVLINKMDDSTVQWSEKRYNECKEKLVPYLKKVSIALFVHLGYVSLIMLVVFSWLMHSKLAFFFSICKAVSHILIAEMMWK